MFSFIQMVKQTVAGALTAFVGLFPAAAIATSLSGVKAAAVAAIGAGFAAVVMAVGNWIKQLREKAKGYLDAGLPEAEALLVKARKLIDEARGFIA